MPFGKKDDKKDDKPRSDDKTGGLLDKLPFGRKDDKPAASAQGKPVTPQRKDDGSSAGGGGIGGRLGGLFNRGDKQDDNKPKPAASSSASPMGSSSSSSSFGSAPRPGTSGGMPPPKPGAPAAKPAGKKAEGGGLFGRLRGMLPGQGGAQSKPASKASSRTARDGRFLEIKPISLQVDKAAEIIGLALAISGIVLVLASLSPTEGSIPYVVSDFLSYWFGWGSVIVALAMVPAGIWLITLRVGQETPQIALGRILGLLLLFFSALAAMQYYDALSYPPGQNQTFAEYMTALRTVLLPLSAEFGRGGGRIGGEIYFQLVNNFSEVIGFVVLLGVLLIALMVTFSISAQEVIAILIGNGRNMRDSFQRRRMAMVAARNERLAQAAALTAATAVSVETEALPAGAKSPALPSPAPATAAAAPVQHALDAAKPEERSIPITLGGRTFNTPFSDQGELVPVGGAAASAPKPAVPVPPVRPTAPSTDKPAASAEKPADKPGEKPAEGDAAKGGFFNRMRNAVPTIGTVAAGAAAAAAKATADALTVNPEQELGTPAEKPADSPSRFGGLGGIFKRGDAAARPEDKPADKSAAKPADAPADKPAVGPLNPAASLGNPAGQAPAPAPAAPPPSPSRPGIPPLSAPAAGGSSRFGEILGGSSNPSSAAPVAPSPSPFGEKPAGAGEAQSEADKPVAPRPAPASPLGAPPARAPFTPNLGTARPSPADDDEDDDEDIEDAVLNDEKPAIDPSKRVSLFGTNEPLSKPAVSTPPATGMAPVRPASASALNRPASRDIPLDDEDDEDADDAPVTPVRKDPAAPVPTQKREGEDWSSLPPARPRGAMDPPETARPAVPPPAGSTPRPSPFGSPTPPLPRPDAPKAPEAPKAGEPIPDLQSRLNALRSMNTGAPRPPDAPRPGEAPPPAGKLIDPLRSSSVFGKPADDKPAERPAEKPTEKSDDEAKSSGAGNVAAAAATAGAGALNSLFAGLANRKEKEEDAGKQDKPAAPAQTPPAPVNAPPPAVMPPPARTSTPSSAFGKPKEDIVDPNSAMATSRAANDPGVKPYSPTQALNETLNRGAIPAGQVTTPSQVPPAASKPPAPAPSAPPPKKARKEWRTPDLTELLSPGLDQELDKAALVRRAKTIEDTLASFGAPGRVVEVRTGPVITQFGVEPDYVESRGGKKARVKVSTIAGLDKDLQLSLGAKSIRIEAPVPGKGYVGIEVPNEKPSVVKLRDVMESSEFQRIKSPLAIALGQGVDGTPVAADLASMPHMLIAGTTGSGKSVAVNTIIASILLRNSPDRVKLVMIDPKRVELTGYNGIPHLVAPVVVEVEKAVGVLKWLTREMDERYRRFSLAAARNIEDFNKHLTAGEPLMPYIVVIIDELADLMMLAADDTEKMITRLAALARATGIHLVIATQRPSVDVVTGLIKANFPARVAFAVAGGVDSRVILDQPGAEKLLGRGDMLFMSGDAPAPARLQGVFVTDTEIGNITRFWRNQLTDDDLANQGKPILSQFALDEMAEKQERSTSVSKQWAPGGNNRPSASGWDRAGSFGEDDDEIDDDMPDSDEDELYERAVDLVRRQNRASTSLLQRHFRIGYTRAARLMDVMEARGIVGPPVDGAKPREVLPKRF
jgi:S-DNA-T family DNA segregation ATPase FtsK/SpoIIIE